MKVGSLFSGIGGLDLGLERAGMSVVWQCESDPYCRAVLRKHWPEVPCYRDVREIELGLPWPQSPEPVDLICGGFPCQPVSFAGKQLAQADERWLWPEFARVLRLLRPRFALVENVPGLLARGMGDVLGDLAELGFDAEWSLLPACAVGASHTRERVFIVAYPAGLDGDARGRLGASSGGRASVEPRGLLGVRVDRSREARDEWLEREPDVARMVTRIPDRTHRLECLGNSVVPQVAEWIGRQLMGAA